MQGWQRPSVRSRASNPRMTRSPTAARSPHRPPRAGHDVRPAGRGSGRRADLAPHSRLGRERRPELVPGVRAAERVLQHRRARPTRARAWTPNTWHLPARGLRRRLRGDTRRTRHRPSDRGRLLDGRTGLAVVVATAPRPRRRPRDVRDRARVHAVFGCAVAYQTWMFGLASAARVAAYAPAIPLLPLGRSRPRRMPAWVAAEMRRHDYRMMVEAGHSLSTYYAGRWIGEIDVPTTILCTSEDRAVRPEWQRDMAAAIPGATCREVEGGHLMCACARVRGAPSPRVPRGRGPRRTPLTRHTSAVVSSEPTWR